MKYHGFLTWFLLTPLAAVLVASSPAEDGSDQLMIWVAKHYSSWDNPLHTELLINDATVNIYTSDTVEPIGTHIREGWNRITLVTTVQEPASQSNQLIFRVGPMHEDHETNQRVMEPVQWEFRNGTDWKFESGKFSHPLGPQVKQVALSFDLYYAGMQRENQQLKEGDYVLIGKSSYSSWDSPVTAMVYLNETPLNSFALGTRQLIVTSLLKSGKNEFKLVSSRVKNVIQSNDVEFTLAGPAEWNVQRGQYVVNPVVQFKSRQGWTQDSKTGQWRNPLAPDSDRMERVIAFMLKEPQ